MTGIAALLELNGLHKRFGGIAATDGLSLSVLEGECLALIGPNGAGKTTVLKQIFGELQQDSGTVIFDGEEVSALRTAERVHRGMSRIFQTPELLPEFTALENVAMAVQARLAHSFRFWRDARSEPALVAPALQILTNVGLNDLADQPSGMLSHGQQRVLEIAVAFASVPRMLLLDEPMAGLGPGETRQMVELLVRLKRSTTMLLIEHDMDAVFRLADRVCVLVAGRSVCIGTTAEVRNDPRAMSAYLDAGQGHA
jgi:branched-chain amino acid transport system ATP-binding protein